MPAADLLLNYLVHFFSGIHENHNQNFIVISDQFHAVLFMLFVQAKYYMLFASGCMSIAAFSEGYTSSAYTGIYDSLSQWG